MFDKMQRDFFLQVPRCVLRMQFKRDRKLRRRDLGPQQVVL